VRLFDEAAEGARRRERGDRQIDRVGGQVRPPDLRPSDLAVRGQEQAAGGDGVDAFRARVGTADPGPRSSAAVEPALTLEPLVGGDDGRATDGE
jgi:hypothetical protein